MTRLTLRTYRLPGFFGGVFTTVEATSDAAFRRLIGEVLRFYNESLFNPHWGEQIAFRPGNVLAIAMVFQGLDQKQAEATWRPLFDWLTSSAGFHDCLRTADPGCAGASLLGSRSAQASPRNGACG